MEKDTILQLLEPDVMELLLKDSSFQELLIKPNKKKHWQNKGDWPSNLCVLMDIVLERTVPVKAMVTIRGAINQSGLKHKYTIPMNRVFRDFLYKKVETYLKYELDVRYRPIALKPFGEWRDTNIMGELPSCNANSMQSVERYMNQALFWDRILFGELEK